MPSDRPPSLSSSQVPKCRILVCGSRTYGRDAADHTQFALAMARFVPDYETTEVVIVHGKAQGADTMADDYAIRHGLKRDVYPADWTAHGRKAGPIRNAEMLASGVDLVIAFWDGKSRGTKDMIERSRKAGARVEVVMFGLRPASPSESKDSKGEK